MITVYGEGRGFRVVWLLEEMGLPYHLHQVDLLKEVQDDAEFLSVNPAGFIPALRDGDVTMVESVAIMQYLLARHGPSPLAPAPDDPGFAPWLQFLHLGEAGLAASVYWVLNANRLPTEAERRNPTARHALWQYENRLAIVRRRLDQASYMAGEAFTAADISVGYALELAHYNAGLPWQNPERAYMDRIRDRDGYRRAMEACPDRRDWFARIDARPSPA